MPLSKRGKLWKRFLWGEDQELGFRHAWLEVPGDLKEKLPSKKLSRSLECSGEIWARGKNWSHQFNR